MSVEQINTNTLIFQCQVAKISCNTCLCKNILLYLRQLWRRCMECDVPLKNIQFTNG